jgi:hypothetical protein
MYKMLSVILTCLLALLAFACAGGGAPNSANTNTNSAAATVNVDNANMPPGLSSSPLPVNGTTPGIPPPDQIHVNMNVKGATPTPGIPDPKNVNKVPKGATPTPGIPSEAELRKMMSTQGNQSIQMQANTQGNTTRNSMPQMKQRKKPQ